MSYKHLICTIEPHFESSFQGYLTCPHFVAPGTWHLAPGTRCQVPGTRCQVQQKVGKWGIPEKNFQNVVQWCRLEVCTTFQSKVIARNRFLNYSPSIAERAIFEQNFFCTICLYWYLTHKKLVHFVKFQNQVFVNRPTGQWRVVIIISKRI